MRRLSFLIYSENPKVRDSVVDQLGVTGRVRIAATVDDARDLEEALARHALDGIYLDLDSQPTLALDAVERINARGILLFTGGTSNDPDLLLRSMRIGARDFFLQHQLSKIDEALNGVDLELTAGVGTAPVIAVVGAKGGVGATTIACELAISLSEVGLRVCVIDLSRRIGDVAMYFDMSPNNSVADIARREGELDAVFLDAVSATHDSGVSLLAASNDLDEVAALTWAKLDRALKILRVEYDCLVLDAPWDFDEHSMRVIDMADHILQVTTCDVPSLTHARIQRRAMERLGATHEHVHTVVNRHDASTTLGLAEIGEHLQAEVAATIADRPDATRRCMDEGRVLRDVAEGREILASIRTLRGKVAEWCRFELPEARSDGDSGLVARLRGLIGRG